MLPQETILGFPLIRRAIAAIATVVTSAWVVIRYIDARYRNPPTPTASRRPSCPWPRWRFWPCCSCPPWPAPRRRRRRTPASSGGTAPSRASSRRKPTRRCSRRSSNSPPTSKPSSPTCSASAADHCPGRPALPEHPARRSTPATDPYRWPAEARRAHRRSADPAGADRWAAEAGDTDWRPAQGSGPGPAAGTAADCDQAPNVVSALRHLALGATGIQNKSSIRSVATAQGSSCLVAQLLARRHSRESSRAAP